MKTCTKCGETKSLDKFGNRTTNSKDGKKWRCKICDRDYIREYRASGRTKKYENTESCKESYRNASEKYRLNNPLAILLAAAKCRAKKKGLDFNIDKRDLIVPDLCPVLGIPLFIGKDKCSDNSPTLDRIDSSKGYVKGNIQVISHRANSIKRNATVEELKKIIKYMNGREIADNLL